MLCGIQGCKLPARHPGLCAVIQKPKRLRHNIPPVMPYSELKVGTVVNVWWDNYGRYFLGRVLQNNCQNRKTKIKYDDGDVVWHNLEFMDHVVLSVPEEKPLINADSVVAHVQELLKCPICMETVKDPMTTRCMHTFCKECLTQALIPRKCCPVCNDLSIKSMRDAVPDARFKGLLTVMHGLNETSTDEADVDSAELLLRLAARPESASEQASDQPSQSTNVPGSPSSSASSLATTSVQAMYHCHSCGGMKKAKAHRCGKSCIS